MAEATLFRGATVYDGTGADPVRADLLVRDGRVAAIGEGARAGADGAEVVDAGGLALMPGIVDLHTHYDAQLTWDPGCSPSPALGVTTAVIGNCGFGIAPCPPALRDTMLRNLSVVEGMDLGALRTGTRWEFETFAGYLDLLRRLGPSLNVAVFAGHSAIRTAVMGEDASLRIEPTAAELAAMVAQVRDAMAAGAIGFASSFSPNHSGWGGAPMPSTIATDAELHAMLEPMREAGRGVFMSATGSRATPEYMEDVAARTGRPAFISTVLAMYSDSAPTRGLAMYDRCAEATDRGHEVRIQASCQPLTFDFDLHTPYVWYPLPSFAPVKAAAGDAEALARIYADPSFREAFRADLRSPPSGVIFTGDWTQVAVAIASDARRDLQDRTIASLAAEAGVDPIDWLFDFGLAERLGARFAGRFFNNRDEGVAPLITHRAGVITLSDAGAHLGYLCDAGFGLHLLGHWARETGTFTLQEAVRRLTSHPADAYRIPGRGRIVAGAAADLLLFDPATVGISRLRAAHDLPGGARRLVRDPVGVHGTWVNGTRTFDGTTILGHAAGRGPGAVLDRFSA
ncbi:MAG: amidohydrolase family protein [Burkholderiales bacterium]|nr:amidohydrolase family protein [Burkholderiales bacterium]